MASNPGSKLMFLCLFASSPTTSLLLPPHFKPLTRRLAADRVIDSSPRRPANASFTRPPPGAPRPPFSRPPAPRAPRREPYTSAPANPDAPLTRSLLVSLKTAPEATVQRTLRAVSRDITAPRGGLPKGLPTTFDDRDYTLLIQAAAKVSNRILGLPPNLPTVLPARPEPNHRRASHRRVGLSRTY